MARAASGVLRPLPRQVKPFPRETAASYFRRLAHANRLDPQALRTYITADRRRGPVPVGRLSVVTGLPGATLRLAIPDLDGGRSHHTVYLNGVPILRSDNGPPCRWCVLARGITQPVWCWKHPEEMICLRHRRWTGPTASDSQQPDLRALPGILHAHRRHLRLVRRFGRDEVAFAFGVADHICRRWHEQRQHDAGFQQHMRIFHGPSWRVPPAARRPDHCRGDLPPGHRAHPAPRVAPLAIAGSTRQQRQPRTLLPRAAPDRRARLHLAAALSLRGSASPMARRAPALRASPRSIALALPR